VADRSLLWVMIGGALGAASRYLIGGWVLRKLGVVFPWGTFVINLSGCLILGFFFGVRESQRHTIPAFLTPGFAIGFVGAYTTFSTFAVETIRLMEVRSYALALGNVAASVVLGLIAAILGLLAGRQI
jgi:CrcB protein